jgi:hypothetical protein
MQEACLKSLTSTEQNLYTATSRIILKQLKFSTGWISFIFLLPNLRMFLGLSHRTSFVFVQFSSVFPVKYLHLTHHAQCTFLHL